MMFEVGVAIVMLWCLVAGGFKVYDGVLSLWGPGWATLASGFMLLVAGAVLFMFLGSMTTGEEEEEIT